MTILKLDPSNICVGTFSMIEGKAFTLKTDNNGNPKLSPDGEKLYRARGLTVLAIADDGKTVINQIQGASVSITNPPADGLNSGMYRFTKLWATPWVNGSSANISFSGELDYAGGKN